MLRKCSWRLFHIEVAGFMDEWPEFEQVLRLGREFRQSASNAAGGLPKAGGSA